MMEAFALHNGSYAERLLAPPILVFEAVPDSGRVKGQVLFHGFGHNKGRAHYSTVKR